MPKSVLTSKNESIHQKAMRIMHLFTNFHSEGRFKKFRIRMPESRDTCGRKPYPET